MAYEHEYTLSDELKYYYELPDEYLNTIVNYRLEVGYTTVYKGSVFYTGPSYIYYNDIVFPYIFDYKWITKLGYTPNMATMHEDGDDEYNHHEISDAAVTLRFYTIDGIPINGPDVNVPSHHAIIPTTELPGVDIKAIPSIIPNTTSTDFVFGWGASGDTALSTSSSEDDIISETTVDGTGKCTIDGDTLRDYMRKTGELWSICHLEATPRSIHKIAEKDKCNSKYFLIWITRNNEYMCRPFDKRVDMTETVDTSYRLSVNDKKVPYLKTTTFNWKLNSDWLTYDEHNVYESLLVSPIVYLYDAHVGKKYEVVITDSSWTEKNAKNNKKPFNLTINAEKNSTQKLIY